MWAKHSEHLDGWTGIHHIFFKNSLHGGTYELQIPVTSEDAKDARAREKQELDLLQRNHALTIAYAKKHNLLMKHADGKLKPVR